MNLVASQHISLKVAVLVCLFFKLFSCFIQASSTEERKRDFEKIFAHYDVVSGVCSFLCGVIAPQAQHLGNDFSKIITGGCFPSG